MNGDSILKIRRLLLETKGTALQELEKQLA